MFDALVTEAASREQVASAVKNNKTQPGCEDLRVNLSVSFSAALPLVVVRLAIMLKRIYRSTPPEVIVEVLEPYVHLTTANVRIIKNRTGPMGHTYGFIDLDSHAVSFPLQWPSDRCCRNPSFGFKSMEVK